MGVSGSLSSALQAVQPVQRRSLPRSPQQPPIETPEFDVRTGAPLSGDYYGAPQSALPPPTPWRPAERDPADDQPVAGDRENAVLRDMGSMPGTGLAQTPASPNDSVASSTPSATGGQHLPTGHGDDNDIVSRIPKLQMPDLSSMPQTDHINQLQAELDASRHPAPQSGWGRVGTLAAKLAPTVIGAAFGGLTGAGMAAEGTAEGLQQRHKNEEDHQNLLLREIEQEQGARNQAYQAAGHVATTNAQLESNAILRDAMMRNQSGIAQGHDQTKTQVAQAGNDSRESIAVDKLDHQRTVDAAKSELIKAQTDLANARAAGIPAQIKLAEARLASSQSFADAAQRRAQVMEDSYERDTFGTQGGKPIPGMPTVGGQVVGPKPYAISGPTGTTKTKMDQVDAITSVGKTLLSEIDKNAAALGPFTGRWKNLEEMWGNLPPEAARIAGLQESFASLQPALHQFRSTSAKRDFERRLQIGSFKTNADAMKAGVQAAMDSATEMKSAWAAGRGSSVTPGPNTATPRSTPSSPFAPPASSVEQWERGPDGRLRRSGGR